MDLIARVLQDWSLIGLAVIGLAAVWVLVDVLIEGLRGAYSDWHVARVQRRIATEREAAAAERHRFHAVIGVSDRLGRRAR